MQPHTLSYSCAVHPVIKLTGAWDSELKKCLLPGTIIVTGCKCTRLWSCNHPSAAGNHWSDVVVSVRGPMGEWTPLYVLCLHQTCQKPMIPWLQWNKSDLACDSPPPPHHPPPPHLYWWHSRPNLKAPLETTQRGQVITVVPFKESSLQCFCLSHWITLSRVASHACWAFLPTLYTPTGGQKSR